MHDGFVANIQCSRRPYSPIPDRTQESHHGCPEAEDVQVEESQPKGLCVAGRPYGPFYLPPLRRSQATASSLRQLRLVCRPSGRRGRLISMLPIAVDAMGGDFAPAAIVDGAKRAHREFGIPIVLVGRPGEMGDNITPPPTFSSKDISVFNV